MYVSQKIKKINQIFSFRLGRFGFAKLFVPNGMKMALTMFFYTIRYSI